MSLGHSNLIVRWGFLLRTSWPNIVFSDSRTSKTNCVIAPNSVHVRFFFLDLHSPDWFWSLQIHSCSRPENPTQSRSIPWSNRMNGSIYCLWAVIAIDTWAWGKGEIYNIVSQFHIMALICQTQPKKFPQAHTYIHTFGARTSIPSQPERIYYAPVGSYEDVGWRSKYHLTAILRLRSEKQKGIDYYYKWPSLLNYASQF